MATLRQTSASCAPVGFWRGRFLLPEAARKHGLLQNPFLSAVEFNAPATPRPLEQGPPALTSHAGH